MEILEYKVSGRRVYATDTCEDWEDELKFGMKMDKSGKEWRGKKDKRKPSGYDYMLDIDVLPVARSRL